jgi:hypothetical protein
VENSRFKPGAYVEHVLIDPRLQSGHWWISFSCRRDRRRARTQGTVVSAFGRARRGPCWLRLDVGLAWPGGWGSGTLARSRRGFEDVTRVVSVSSSDVIPLPPVPDAAPLHQRRRQTPRPATVVSLTQVCLCLASSPSKV